MSIKEFNHRKKAFRKLLDDFIEKFRNFMHHPEIDKMVQRAIEVYKAALRTSDEIYFGGMRLN